MCSTKKVFFFFRDECSSVSYVSFTVVIIMVMKNIGSDPEVVLNSRLTKRLLTLISPHVHVHHLYCINTPKKINIASEKKCLEDDISFWDAPCSGAMPKNCIGIYL